MASESEASCDADPNFAVICSFLEKFGQACGLHTVDFLDLQEMLENTQEVSPILIELHVKLMRKMRRSVNAERWERSVVKICHSYSNQDAWEIERFGYKKSRLSVKLRLLKELLEMQFDSNASFKNKINVITAKELRSHPLGRDKLGNAYWYQADDNCQIRVYKEDLDEETWALVAKDREGLVTLISKLGDNQDSSSTDVATNEDSNSVENKPILDTGQQDSNSSNGKKSHSDEEKPVTLLKEEVDDEDTKMEGKPLGKLPSVEEKKPELSGIKEKYIRSDNFVQSNRKAVESAGFVDVDVGLVEVKRPSSDDIDEELSLLKRPRTDRPSLLGDKKKPYLRDEFNIEYDDEEEEEEDEYVEEEEEDDDEDIDDDDESPVGDEIDEPLMLVMGKGNGAENECENVIVGEEIAEDVIYFHGEGSGNECETGNDKKEDSKDDEKENGRAGDQPGSSITSSPTKNNFKLGMIIDTKTDFACRNSARVQTKKSKSRWDIGKPDDASNSDLCSQIDSNCDQEKQVNDSGAVRTAMEPVKKPSFFFGPSSGFTFKTPTPITKAITTNFLFGTSQVQKPKLAISSPKTQINDEPFQKLCETEIKCPQSSETSSKPDAEESKNSESEMEINEKHECAPNNKTMQKSDLTSSNCDKMVKDVQREEESKETAVKINTIAKTSICDDAATDKEEVLMEDEKAHDISSISKDVVQTSIDEETETNGKLHDANEHQGNSPQVIKNETLNESSESQEVEQLPLDLATTENNEEKVDCQQITQTENLSEVRTPKLPLNLEIKEVICKEDKEDNKSVAVHSIHASPEMGDIKSKPSGGSGAFSVENLLREESDAKNVSESDAVVCQGSNVCSANVEVIEQISPEANDDLRKRTSEVECFTVCIENIEKEVEKCEEKLVLSEEPVFCERIELQMVSEVSETTDVEVTKEKSIQEDSKEISDVSSNAICDKAEENIESASSSKLSETLDDVAEILINKEDVEDRKHECSATIDNSHSDEVVNLSELSSLKTQSNDEPFQKSCETEMKCPQLSETSSKLDAEKSRNSASEMEINEKHEHSPESIQIKETLSDAPTPVEEAILTPISSIKNKASQVPTDKSDRDLNTVSSTTLNENVELMQNAKIGLEDEHQSSVESENLTEHNFALQVAAAFQRDIRPPVVPIMAPILTPEDPHHIVLDNKPMPELQPIGTCIDEMRLDYKPEASLPPLLSSNESISDTLHMFSAHSTLMGESDQSDLLEVAPIKESSYISIVNPQSDADYIHDEHADFADLSKMPTVLSTDAPNDDPVVIQEIGSLTTLEPKKATDCPSQIENEIVPFEVASNLSRVFPISVPVDVPDSAPKPFNEVPCEKKSAALLTEADDQASDGDINYDDDNISEPMDLEESKNSQIIEHGDIENVSEEHENQAEVKTEKKPSLQSLSLDFTGEAPDLSEVQALVNRSRKRGAEEEAKLHDEDSSEEASAGKRRKIRNKRSVDKNLRKTIEDAKNKDISSSDEDVKKPKIVQDVTKPEKKAKGKRKKLMLGLEIPDDGVLLDQPTGLRQSRRIAQLKIKEEAERRKLEEIALEEMKNSQKKRSKKDEDKDYKAEKRKRNKILTDDETSNDAELDDKTTKKKKKRKHRKFDEHNPWRTSSEDSSTEDSHVEDEEEEEEYNYVEIIKSDHEFSPESDLENNQDVEPLKRARTVRKEDQEEEEFVDDTNCQKCNKSDHPEWILLCDGCDSGWHCSCLRPALLVIPEGEWYCPPCQHSGLVKLLQDKLAEFDKIQTKREMEIRRKERLAYVGISLDNVLPAKDEESQKSKRQKLRRTFQADAGSADETGSASNSQKSASDSDSDSESESSSSSSDSDEPIYKLRQRRQAQSYRFKDYDELIKSAVQEEVDEMQHSYDYQSKGKDMSTIVQAETVDKTVEAVAPPPDHAESDEDVVRPVKKIIGKKKHRKLNSLDISSEEDEDSDEDFKGSSDDEDEDEEYDEYNDYGSSSSSSLIGKRRKGKGIRRSTRARTSRYDAEFINDESEDSDEPRRKRNRSDWDESDETEDESDNSWRSRKKRSRKRVPTASLKEKKKKSKKSKNRDDSDPEVYRRKKLKNKFGAFDEADIGRRRTRGKKINYLDALGTDSEEEVRRRNQAKDEESEDEFVLNEEEDDARYEEGREGDDSDDSTTGRLVPGVKKGSKKGKGKGGIKRIKRAQGEEEEALFPPLISTPSADTLQLIESEPNPIEQINKNLEAMDEKEIGMMMEEEEYANKQLQMVAAQLEKEKRRKEMEARKLEIVHQQSVVSSKILHSNTVPSVIQTMPVAMPQLMPSQLRSLQPEQMHPHDMPPHAMLSNLPPLHQQQSPHHMQQLSSQNVDANQQQCSQRLHQHSPKHMMHLPQSSLMADAGTPKKRGRRPKSQQLGTPELQTGQPSGDESDISLAYNTDGTPKKRRGRGKGKKTLEKEAAAAAATAPVRSTESKEVSESKNATSEIMPIAGGKLGVAAAPQPFSQSQPKPSVITRMLQAQPGQPAYPVGSHTFPERQPPPGSQPPFMGGPGPLLSGVPQRGLHPGTFRPGVNHYPVIRSGAPPIRPQNMQPHIYHHPIDAPSLGAGGGAGGSAAPAAVQERSSPAHSSPASVSPLSNKSDQTPPPPPFATRTPMVRFPPISANPGGPRHPQLLPQLHPSRPPYPGVPSHHTNYHYAPSYAEGGGAPPPAASGSAPFHVPPAQYQEQFASADAEGGKNYDEENGEFGGLVSYFSSQREDDLDS